MTAETCVTDKKNLGTIRCDKLPQMPRLMIETPEDFYLTPEQIATPAALKTALQDAIVGGLNIRIYLWPNFVGYENASEDAIYEETPLSDLAVRPGKYRFRFHVRKNLCMHKAMFTHNTNSGRVYIVDVKNQIVGTTDPDGNFYGFTMSMLNVEKLMFSDGTVASKTPIYVVLSDSNELDESGAMVNGSGVVNTLKRLTDVTVTQVDGSDEDELTVLVQTECDGVPVIGLIKADFTFLDENGDEIDPGDVTFTDNGDGTYLLAGVGIWATGAKVDLILAANLSIKAYESIAPLVVDLTVPSV